MRPPVSFLIAILCAATPSVARAQGGDLAPHTTDYLSGYWKARPVTAATPAGIHSQDKLLEDWSATGVQAEIARDHAFLNRLEKIDPRALPGGDRADRDRLMSHIRLELARLEVFQQDQTRPDLYVRLLGDAVWQLASRQFAPATARFAAAGERLKLVPKFLKQARLTLSNPPEIQTRKAIALAPAVADYLEKEFPNAAVQQGVEKRELARVQKESHAAAAAVREFGKWLESDLLPRSKGSGLAPLPLYRQIFRDFLGTEMALEDVIAAAERELRVMPIPPPPPQPLDSYQVMQAFRQQEKEARLALESRKITPVPTPDRLQFEMAPLFWSDRRMVLDPAGPFEPDLAHVLYLPPGVAFSRDSVKAALVRNAFPGAYTQRDAMNHTDSVIRKVFVNRAFVVGWEEYAAVLAKEAGFGAADPQHDREILLDAIFDVRINSGKITPEEALKQLTGQFACTPAEAEYRVWRALSSPGELSAAYVGKLELLKLRADRRKELGAAYVPIEYHARLLSLGAPDFSDARELLK